MKVVAVRKFEDAVPYGDPRYWQVQQTALKAQHMGGRIENKLDWQEQPVRDDEIVRRQQQGQMPQL